MPVHNYRQQLVEITSFVSGLCFSETDVTFNDLPSLDALSFMKNGKFF